MVLWAHLFDSLVVDIKKGPEGPEDAEHATTAYQWSGPVRRLFTDGSEKAHRIDVVADQQVLGLLIAVEDHLVGLATDTGFLVTTEGGVGRVHVVAVGPYPPSLDTPTHAVGDVHVPGPDTGAEAELGIVGNGQRFGLVLEGSDADQIGRASCRGGGRVAAAATSSDRTAVAARPAAH